MQKKLETVLLLKNKSTKLFRNQTKLVKLFHAAIFDSDWLESKYLPLPLYKNHTFASGLVMALVVQSTFDDQKYEFKYKGISVLGSILVLVDQSEFNYRKNRNVIVAALLLAAWLGIVELSGRACNNLIIIFP